MAAGEVIGIGSDVVPGGQLTTPYNPIVSTRGSLRLEEPCAREGGGCRARSATKTGLLAVSPAMAVTFTGYARYFAYLNLFVFFMLTLVLGANFPVMFVGWEGVGLCSYLLIGFWFNEKVNADAGLKAFIVNRILLPMITDVTGDLCNSHAIANKGANQQNRRK